MGTYFPSKFMSEQRYNPITENLSNYKPVQIDCINCHKKFTWLEEIEPDRIFFRARKPHLCGNCEVKEPYLSYLWLCETYNEGPEPRGKNTTHHKTLRAIYSKDWDEYFS